MSLNLELPTKPAAGPLATVDPAATERARIGAILGHEYAAGRGKFATHIAFSTAMSVEDAISMLAASAIESPTAAAPATPAAANAAFSWDDITAETNAKTGVSAPARG